MCNNMDKSQNHSELKKQSKNECLLYDTIYTRKKKIVMETNLY